MTRRLSRREAHRLALHYAINERDSLVDAYSRGMQDDPAPVRAAWLAAEFRRVLAKEFGQRTVEDEMVGQGTPVSIFELAARNEDGDDA